MFLSFFLLHCTLLNLFYMIIHNAFSVKFKLKMTIIDLKFKCEYVCTKVMLETISVIERKDLQGSCLVLVQHNCGKSLPSAGRHPRRTSTQDNLKSDQGRVPN